MFLCYLLVSRLAFRREIQRTFLWVIEQSVIL